MNKKRPINLNLTTLRYPPMAIVSILHRISGIGIFLLLPLMLFSLSLSLHSADSFFQARVILTESPYRWGFFVFGAAMIYHVIAGIRHVIMDMGFGESLCAARFSAITVMLLSFLLILFLGIRLW